MSVDIEVVGAVLRRSGHTALDGAHLRVGAGDLVVVFGATGSGKTTLLRAIAGLDRLDAGTIRLDGVDVGGRSPRERRASLVTSATPAMIRQVLVELAPRLLLLDAPDGFGELRSIRDLTGVTMIVASSDPRALAIADRVAVLRGGEVVQTGDPGEIVADPADVEVARLTGPLDLAPAIVERDPPGAWIVGDGWRERVWRPSVVARHGREVLAGRRGDQLLVFDAATGRQLR